NGVDEDCNGNTDDEPADCDSAVPLEGDDPVDAARALGLCRKAVAGSWGLVSARWTFPDGATGSGYNDKLGCDPPQTGQPPAALQRGLLPGFGPAVAPREGKAMLALSSGAARPGHLELNPPLGEGSSPG